MDTRPDGDAENAILDALTSQQRRGEISRIVRLEPDGKTGQRRPGCRILGAPPRRRLTLSVCLFTNKSTG